MISLLSPCLFRKKLKRNLTIWHLAGQVHHWNIWMDGYKACAKEKKYTVISLGRKNKAQTASYKLQFVKLFYNLSMFLQLYDNKTWLTIIICCDCKTFKFQLVPTFYICNFTNYPSLFKIQTTIIKLGCLKLF